MKSSKVSIVSPCYNGSKYLNHFLESLLNQTYSNVEFIFINDGSTDNTEEILKKYKRKLEKKGWVVKYIKQDNAGQAAALNTGLKEVTGDYLIYPDSDDILYSSHIEEKVEYMDAHPEIGMAFCILDVVLEHNLDKIIRQDFRKHTDDDNLAMDLINFKNILWPPLGNIIRTKSLFSVIPDREIYKGRGGQNFQIQFPMAINFKYGYINKPLGKYVLRGESYSHSAPQDSQRLNKFMNIWINTIQNIPNKDLREFYISKAVDCFIKKIHIQTVDTFKTNKVEQYKNVEHKEEYSMNYKLYLFGFIPVFCMKKKQKKLKIRILGIPIIQIIKR